jgi:hypothetical protein
MNYNLDTNRGKIMVKKIIFVTAILMIFISGCSQLQVETPTVTPKPTDTIAPSQAQIEQTEEVYVFKTSQPGFFTIKGTLVVMDPMLMFPDLDDGIFLVPMDDQVESLTTVPKFEKGTVPQAEVDEVSGDFAFTNIDPGQYAIVVLTMNGDQVPARFYESESMAILTLEENDETQLIELGNLMFP